MNINEHRIYNEVEVEHWWFRARREMLKAILVDVHDKDCKAVLDVGCGSGGNLEMLFDAFGSVDGIDNSLDSVSLGMSLGRSNVRYFDACSLAEIEKKVDMVSFLDVLYHRDILDYKNVLKNTGGILRKNGFILIADGAFDCLSGHHTDAVHGARRFRKKQLIKVLEDLGYDIVTAIYWGFVPFFIIYLKRRLFDRVLTPSLNKSDVTKVSGFSNWFMYHLVAWEVRVLKTFDMPLGSSVLILAKKTVG